MLLIGFLLMIVGLCMGFYSINKATKREISAEKLGWICYGGIFIALIGSVFVGKVW